MSKSTITVSKALKQASAKKLAALYANQTVSRDILGKYGTKACRKQIKKYIKKLRKIKPKKNSEELFFVSHMLDDDGLGPKPYFNQVKLSDLLNNQIIDYGYEYEPFKKVLGYKIVLTSLTKYYLDDLLVDILYEMSWTGFDQEDRKSEIKELNRRIKESEKEDKKGETIEINSRKGLADALGLDISKSDHFDAFEYRLSLKLSKLSTDLWWHSQCREAYKVLRKLGYMKYSSVKIPWKADDNQ